MPKITLENGAQIEISQESYNQFLAVSVKGTPLTYSQTVKIERYRSALHPHRSQIQVGHKNLAQLGLYFRTETEANKHHRFLKARTTILQWANCSQTDFMDGYSVHYITKSKTLTIYVQSTYRDANIVFHDFGKLKRLVEEYPQVFKDYLGVARDMGLKNNQYATLKESNYV